MSEIKCSVCGATPMESEDIYSDMYGEYRHRHLNQCICFLGARIHALEWALRLVLDQADYTTGSCRPNEMAGAVLNVQVINKVKGMLK